MFYLYKDVSKMLKKEKTVGLEMKTMALDDLT